jgi:alkylhydroperoxidase family enzyme
MARLPYLDPATASDDVRTTLAALPARLNIFLVMAHAETCFRPLVRLGSAILGQQHLDARLRELAILRIANLSSARYEWVQHVPIALSTGVTQPQVDALERGDVEAGCFAVLERLVLRFTTEVVRDVRASEATFAALAEQLPPRQVVELVLAIGYYMLIARLAETIAIDVDAPMVGAARR